MAIVAPYQEISNEVCLICEHTFESKGYHKRSWTFGFCCELCVGKATRTACRQNRRLRKGMNQDANNSVRGKLSCTDWLICLYNNNFSCATCKTKTPSALTCDHIIPISEGGDNRFYNIQPLCRVCHDQKDNYQPRKSKSRMRLDNNNTSNNKKKGANKSSL